MRNYDTNRQTLKDIIIHESVELKALAIEIGIARESLTLFLWGRASRKKEHSHIKPDERPREYVNPEPPNLAKIETYLARRALPAKEKMPKERGRQNFAVVITEWIARGFQVEIFDWGIVCGDRHYSGGHACLTMEDYEAFAPLLSTDADRDDLFGVIREAERSREREAAREARRKRLPNYNAKPVRPPVANHDDVFQILKEAKKRS